MICIYHFIKALVVVSVIAVTPQHHIYHHKGCHTKACDQRVNHRWWIKHHPRPHWVLPWPVVNCESKGTNEARHVYAPGIDPAGYYQIISSTWSSYGGKPPNDASRHSKAEQDHVALKILHKGGLNEWDCAVKLGYV